MASSIFGVSINFGSDFTLDKLDSSGTDDYVSSLPRVFSTLTYLLILFIEVSINSEAMS